MNAKPIVRRLSWAGISIEALGKLLVVDALEGANGEVQGRIGANRLPLIPIADRPIDYAVVTHLHKDHFDAEALGRRLAAHATIFAPAAAATELGAMIGKKFNIVSVNDRQTVVAEPFKLTAVPAVDGFGAPQSSWLIEAEGVKIFHGGDTLFHGYWWEIAKIAGGLDAAFLPINGARIAIPGLKATGLNGVMTAEQAAVAARLLKAKVAVPIHYQEFHSPPVYNADQDAESSFLRFAAREKVTARVVPAGQAVFTDAN